MTWTLCPAEHPSDLSKGLQQVAEQTAVNRMVTSGLFQEGNPAWPSASVSNQIKVAPSSACHVAQGASLGSPEELRAACPNSRIYGHALSRGDCVPRAPEAGGASRPSSHRAAPFPSPPFSLGCFLGPKLLVITAASLEPSLWLLLSLPSPISLSCLTGLISHHLPIPHRVRQKT